MSTIRNKYRNFLFFQKKEFSKTRKILLFSQFWSNLACPFFLEFHEIKKFPIHLENVKSRDLMKIP